MLPKGGTYTLKIQGNNATSTGSYRFRLLNLAADSTPLTLGATTTGTTPSDETDFHRFTGAPGQRLLFDSLAADGGAANQVYYTLFNPDGSTLTSGWAYGDGQPITLVQAGEYHLRLEPNAAAATNYSFRLIDVDATPAEAYTLETTKTATMDPGNSVDVYTFDGTAGQRLYVDILSPDSPYSGFWRLYDPNDQSVVSGSYIRADYDGEVVLPSTGRYVLAFFGNGADASFDYGFKVVAATATSTALTLGDTVTGTLAKPGDQREFTFSGTAGQRIAVDLLNNLSGSIRLALYDELGNVLFNSTGDLNSLTLTRSGVYRAVVDGYGDATGSFSFRAVDLATAATPNVGADKAVVQIHLDAATTDRPYVYYQTADGTAKNGEDYVARSGYVYFAPGLTSRWIVAPIVGDKTVEPDETFEVRLTSPSSGQTIVKSAGTVTILNDDTSATMAIDDVTRVEGSGGGTTAFVFTVTLSDAVADPVTVHYKTADGAATAGSDYEAAEGTVTFAPGETTRTITVQVTADDDGEANETFFIDLSSPTNAEIARGRGKGTILNDDARVSIDDVVVTEGDSGTARAVFTVTLSSPSSLPVGVNWSTANGTAASPSDYTAVSGTLTFDPGETSKTIVVTIQGDPNPEPDETFFVNLSNATNAAFSKAQGKGTILNDDAALSIYDAWIVEGDSGTKDMLFTVSIPYASTKTVTVDFATEDGDATAGSDYATTAGALTFAPGETSKTVRAPILGDTTPEANETFVVRLSNATNAAIARAAATGPIYNDDTTISIDDASIVEGDYGTSTVNVTVRLSVASSGTVTVKYATADGTATAGSDYVAKSGALVFSPGQTTQTVAITVNGDAVAEPDESFHVKLSDPTAALIADPQGTVTIRNDDGSLRVQGVSAREGDSGTRGFDFTVSLDHASTKTVTVDYATEDGAAEAGTDYAAVSGSLAFNPGETSKVVRVLVNGDVLVEDDEDFQLVLSNPSDAVLAVASATGLILNDDAPPSLSIGSAAVTEGDSGTTAATFTVTLSTASAKEVTVKYATSGVTATSGADFKAASGTLVFAPGETSKTISVDVIGDLLDEDDETFHVTLSSPTDAVIANVAGVGTIVDDDEAPTISIADASVAEGDVGTVDAGFTITLSAASGKTITVQYATADGSASAGSDYEAGSGTLTFAPGETSKTIAVRVGGDVDVEPDETFTVNLSNATNAAIGNAVGVGAILNDDHEADPAPTIASIVIDDGAAQRSMVRKLTVTFSEPVTPLPGAFVLKRSDGASVDVVATTRVEGGRTVAVLTFQGAGIVGGSLADGDYVLTVLADKVTDSAGQNLDGNGDGAANDAAIFELYRFFGDLDGDRDVDALDYAKLYQVRGLKSYLDALDFDGDGAVDAIDIQAFLANYRKALKKP